ncbi:glycerophosphodiester phosphodiesterase [Photobacterium swingsii]|uniref:Glycerophosphoryl diester phosphodiesterase n=1 Tax=Photobacterium swingsii TaxID=680026 RepID=A0A0J8VFN9_9GAMM|nr:glycerophosphodiester phosphodiesterase family protein [Photobacterium swingsii]KMV32248.1 glycerophosphodiester phosphodiesterase [Photobacterium swingsii]PSW27062.1 glycerophosphoryl diester phosphodiesterase [Photobacterium swingsii]
MISGHRGARALAPENTLAGIKKAAECGTTWVEMDVQLSADRVPVMIHDKTVNRCTNGRGSVGKMSLETLKQLDANAKFSGADKDLYSEEQIPTLEEALLLCEQLGITMNLEIKIHRKTEVLPLVEQIVKTVKQLNFPLDKLVFSSFDLGVLTYCKTLYPEVRRGLITSKNKRNMMRKAQELSLYSIHYDQSKLTENMATKIKAAGLQLHIWTMNEPDKAAMFRSWGVDNIITDYPNQF